MNKKTLNRIIEQEKTIYKTNKSIKTEHKKLVAKREDFNSMVVAHLLENRVGHPVDVSQIEEGVWDSIKFGLSKLGSLEKGGKIFGDRKGRTAAAEKEMQASIDKASSEAVNTMVQQLAKEYPGWPNIKDSTKFAESMMVPLIAYDSIVAATKKDPDAEGYIHPEAANGAIEAIEKVLKFNLDYKLADIYKHTNEEEELEGEVLEEVLTPAMVRMTARLARKVAEQGYDALSARQANRLEKNVARLSRREADPDITLTPTEEETLRIGRRALSDDSDAPEGMMDFDSDSLAGDDVDFGGGDAADAVDVGGDAADAADVADVGGDAADVADVGGDAADAADVGGDAADVGGDAADVADVGGDAADAADVAGGGGGGEGMSEAAMAAANSAALKAMLIKMGIVVAVGAAALAFGRYKMAKSSRNSQMNKAIKELKPVNVPAGQELGPPEGEEQEGGEGGEGGGGEGGGGEGGEGGESPRGDIYVFRGKGGKGMQSQFAKSGIKGGDMSRLMKGLRGDLTAAGFNVLEEAKRETISLEQTLAALEQIEDASQKEAAKAAIVQMLRKHKVRLDPQSSMALRPAQGGEQGGGEGGEKTAPPTGNPPVPPGVDPPGPGPTPPGPETPGGDKEEKCPPGMQRNPAGACVPFGTPYNPPPGEEEKQEKCPPGMTRNPEGACVPFGTPYKKPEKKKRGGTVPDDFEYPQMKMGGMMNEQVSKVAENLEEGLTFNRWAKIAGIIKG